MKNNIKKIIPIAVALVVLVSAIFCVAVSAAEAKAYSKPEIVSQNVAYQGDFALMYAVPVASCEDGDGALFVHISYNDRAGNLVERDYAPVKGDDGNPKVEAINGVDCYTFITGGVAAADMQTVVTVYAKDKAGRQSDAMTYSVAEYLYERLIVDAASITADQKELYQNVLAMGKSAEKVVAKKTSNFVTDVNYVFVSGDAAVAGDDWAVIVNDNDTVTPVSETAKKFDCYTVDINGNKTLSKSIANGESVTVTDHLYIEPVNSSEKIETFDGLEVGASEFGMGKQYEGTAGHTFGVAEIAGVEGKVFKLTDTANAGNASFVFANGQDNAADNVSIVEFDIMLTETTAGGYEFKQYRSTWTNNTIPTYITITANNETSKNVEFQLRLSNSSQGIAKIGKTVALDINTFHKIRYEHQHFGADTLTVMYVDNIHIGTVTTTHNNITEPVRMAMFRTNAASIGDIYFDNIYMCTKTAALNTASEWNFNQLDADVSDLGYNDVAVNLKGTDTLTTYNDNGNIVLDYNDTSTANNSTITFTNKNYKKTDTYSYFEFKAKPTALLQNDFKVIQNFDFGKNNGATLLINKGGLWLEFSAYVENGADKAKANATVYQSLYKTFNVNEYTTIRFENYVVDGATKTRLIVGGIVMAEFTTDATTPVQTVTIQTNSSFSGEMFIDDVKIGSGSNAYEPIPTN